MLDAEQHLGLQVSPADPGLGSALAGQSVHALLGKVPDAFTVCLQVVQGYKFNVFYSDLLEKSEAPGYALDKDPNADEHGSTCLLRFHAGADCMQAVPQCQACGNALWSCCVQET